MHVPKTWNNAKRNSKNTAQTYWEIRSAKKKSTRLFDKMLRKIGGTV
jgi:hypothetical protein